MLGGVQPDRLREALAGADDGLAARFGYVWPEPLPILPLPSEPDAAARSRRERLTAAARRLYALAMDGDPAGEPGAARLVRLDGEALALFDELRQDAMQRAGPRAGWRPVGTARRRAGHCGLALVFELLAGRHAHER